MPSNVEKLYNLIAEDSKKKQSLFLMALNNPKSALEKICEIGRELDIQVTKEEFIDPNYLNGIVEDRAYQAQVSFHDGEEGAYGFSDREVNPVEPASFIPVPHEGFDHTPGGRHQIHKGHAIVFEVIPYANGQLDIAFDARDDFKLSDLLMYTDLVDTDEEYELASLYYNYLFPDVQRSAGNAFDEDTIRGIVYKLSLIHI